jgi:hypothetical protein
VNVSVFIRVVVCARSFPNDFVLEIIFAKDFIEHHLDVMTGVPVAMVIETPGLTSSTAEDILGLSAIRR